MLENLSPPLRNSLAVIAGIIFGGIANGLIIKYGSPLFPLPEGVDPNDVESIKANIHLYSVGNLMIPFLAHAIGTFLGAYLATKIAGIQQLTLGMIVGAFFLFGGISMVIMVGGPLWFILLDLIVAYIPMGMLGARIAYVSK